MSIWLEQEFQLLLRLAGFARWESFGTPERDPLEIGLEDTQSFRPCAQGLSNVDMPSKDAILGSFEEPVR